MGSEADWALQDRFLTIVILRSGATKNLVYDKENNSKNEMLHFVQHDKFLNNIIGISRWARKDID